MLVRPIIFIAVPDQEVSTHPQAPENIMKLCPVSIAVGCKKCPVFSICPVKSSIGDYTPPKKPAPKKDK
jgi:hypothetical protein